MVPLRARRGRGAAHPCETPWGQAQVGVESDHGEDATPTVRVTEHSFRTLGWPVLGALWKPWLAEGPFTRRGWLVLSVASMVAVGLLMWGLAAGGEAWRASVWRGEYARFELDGVWGKHLFDCNYVGAVNPHFPPRTRAVWLKRVDECWRHDFPEDYAANHPAAAK
jgi:hypothetical protein